MVRRVQLLVDSTGWVTICGAAWQADGHEWQRQAEWTHGAEERQEQRQGWRGHAGQGQRQHWSRGREHNMKEEGDVEEKIRRMATRIAKLESVVEYLEKERKKEKEERKRETAAVALRLEKLEHMTEGLSQVSNGSSTVTLIAKNFEELESKFKDLEVQSKRDTDVLQKLHKFETPPKEQVNDAMAVLGTTLPPRLNMTARGTSSRNSWSRSREETYGIRERSRW
eukprot:TRINITY_DN36864_c0_g1_i1.p1 TRINITY_DN36864_c0_g1~~TRINITY_DN36864_c0_g1_i1.p1  ORF type:complete len:225 (-),score=52.40 TRINITY_DN36864_c0_g1_i1:237-911(-)